MGAGRFAGATYGKSGPRSHLLFQGEQAGMGAGRFAGTTYGNSGPRSHLLFQGEQAGMGAGRFAGACCGLLMATTVAEFVG
jgi:hypothetical protein